MFLGTNPFVPDDPQYHPGATVPFSTPVFDSAHLIQAAQAGLQRIYRSGYRYKKAGVILMDLGPAQIQQGDLFAAQAPDARSRLLALVDETNRAMGRGTLRFAAEGIAQPWKMKRERVTPAYTSDWGALPEV